MSDPDTSYTVSKPNVHAQTSVHRTFACISEIRQESVHFDNRKVDLETKTDMVSQNYCRSEAFAD